MSANDDNAVREAVAKAARPAAHWLRVAVERLEGARYRVGGIELESRNLWKHLEGCREAFFFCATLGAGVDALLRRYAYKSAAELYAAHRVANAMIEKYCDECQARMRDESASGRERHRFRFAPGYGDLPLAVQRPLLAALDSQRRAGITLTDTLLMIPSKSISAIIGIEP